MNHGHIKGLRVRVSKLRHISAPQDFFILGNNADPDEMRLEYWNLLNGYLGKQD